MPRKLYDTDYWKALTAKQRDIAITLLKQANHKEGVWFDGAKMIEVKRGQLITSRQGIKLLCGKGITDRNIRTALSVLVTIDFLTIQATKHYSVLTIKDYDEIQNPENYQTKAKRPTERPATDQQTSLNNNVKNVKKEYIYPSNSKNVISDDEALLRFRDRITGGCSEAGAEKMSRWCIKYPHLIKQFGSIYYDIWGCRNEGNRDVWRECLRLAGQDRKYIGVDNA